MSTKKYISLDRMQEYDTLIKQKIASGDDTVLASAKSYADSGDAATLDSSKSYTDGLISGVNEVISNISTGATVVKEAEHATSADTATSAENATHAENADEATHATSADSATSATKATQDANGNVIIDTYEAKTDAQAKLAEAKEYTDGLIESHTHSWNELEDKPFGEKSVVEVKLNKEPLVFEQHRDNYTVSGFVDYPLYPVVGNEYAIEVNNEHYVCLAIDSGYGEVCFGDIRVKYGNDEYTVPFYFKTCPQSDNTVATSFVHAKAGVYTVNIIEVVEKTTTIPSEMLPEGYPYSEVKEKVLVEEMNVTTSDTGNGIFAQNPFAIFLQSGQKYTVIWDGTPYECLCKDVGGAYIGNGSLVGMEADTGEPFFVGISGNGSFVYSATAGTHTISITTIEETLVTLDEKYLPDTIARVSDLESIDLSAYETTENATAKLDEAKLYADNAANTAATTVKNDLLNGAGEAYDTLKELGDLISTNVDAIEALETVATGKADKVHTHVIADVTDLQAALDVKAKQSDLDAHTGRITALETKVGDGFEEITSAEIQALFSK